MLFLLFQLDKDRYALPASRIARVLPIAPLKQIPNGPPWVAGVFSYHSTSVPVIDLSALALGRPAQRRLSTRLVLVHYPEDRPASHLLGLVMEGATQTLRCDPQAFTAYGIDNEGAPYLGPVLDDPGGLIQWIKVTDLLPKAVQAMLFPAKAAG